MRNLMRHHACELRFVVGGLDRAAIDEHVAAGQGKRINGLVVNTMKLKRVLHAAGGKFCRQSQTKLRQVSVYLGVIAEWQLPLGVRCGAFAQVDILLGRKHIPARFELGSLRTGLRPRKNQEQQEKGAA